MGERRDCELLAEPVQSYVRAVDTDPLDWKEIHIKVRKGEAGFLSAQADRITGSDAEKKKRPPASFEMTVAWLGLGWKLGAAVENGAEEEPDG